MEFARSYHMSLRVACVGAAALCYWFSASTAAWAVGGDNYSCSAETAGAFAVAGATGATPLWVSREDHPGLHRVVKLLQEDVARVTGKTPDIATDESPQGPALVIIGTLGKSPLIDRLVSEGKLDVGQVAGKWEASLTQVVDNPLPGVDRALVIAGSDKRGTIYGMFDLSEQIGVSPWYWWADVPPRRQAAIHVAPGPHVRGEPAVKYRGIFINDEAPALANWAQEKFGRCNRQFYDHVFQLILRLRGNYLWPAMWGRSLWDDDPNSAPLADEYGIVLGNSHHEPLQRAHVEWERYGNGPWNYEKNEAKLQEFWREGMRRMNGRESIVTVGMRGDGDEPMSEEANVALLQRIVADQREIIAEVTGQPAHEQPQIWALYKEVQDYYDRGMRVPDDVTLLLCDDNWGNIRKLPRPGTPPHPGGYGVYYHFDYVGGPRNYKWINTNSLPRIWEQMNLAYQLGARQIWIVNVGDIKPMELPSEFFLDFAWDPDRWPAERIAEYQRLWAEREFGPTHADAIAALVAKYANINGRRKPELLDADTYSVTNFREAATVLRELKGLADLAERIGAQLPPEYADAYYQLVLHPVLATANLHQLYVTVALNRLYAEQGRAQTNTLAGLTRGLFAYDVELSDRYHQLGGGKWNHMMSQTHIGYDNWQQPEVQKMPEVREIEVPDVAEMGVAIEGSDKWWPNEAGEAVLPELAPYSEHGRWIDLFNRGSRPFSFSVDPGAPWVKVSRSKGEVTDQERIEVGIDWEAALADVDRVPITITSTSGQTVVVQLPVNRTGWQSPDSGAWIENDGYVSIDAEDFARSVDAGPLKWQRVPDLGRTAGAVMPTPVTAERQAAGTGPRLEYDVLTTTTGEVTVAVYVSPTLDYYNGDGFRYAVSFDDAEPQVVNIHTDKTDWGWQQMVAANINKSTSRHQVDAPCKHTLKLWMIDPGVVVQKLVLETGPQRTSYLGPPPSSRVP